MKRTHLIQRLGAAGLVSVAVLGSVSCGEVSRTGRSPAFVIIDSMEAASGGPDSGQFAAFLNSDVLTNDSVYNDSGRATFRLGLKNPGTPTAPLGPTALNEVTFTRYRVRYIRADGRNTPGVHVPYGFDGGMTVTVPASGTVDGVFDLVRHTNKFEPPLSNLRGDGAANLINTIAEVTFYGRDQTGNDVQVTGTIQVNFSDFGDSE